MKEVNVTPTSRVTARTDPLELRTTKTTRLIFRPLVVENPNDAEACVKGEFVFQKKSRNDEWVDHSDLTLNHLKAEEWIKVSLKSREVLKLFRHLADLYELYQQQGIPRVDSRFLRVESNLGALLDATEEDLQGFLRQNQQAGLDLLARLLRWIIGQRNPEAMVKRLEALEVGTLRELNSLVGLGSIKKALTIWRDNRTNDDERFWQRFFVRYYFALSSVFSYPVVLVQERAYLGGKRIDNRSGSLIDYLAKNELTKNAVLVEIKTPTTKLLGSAYRESVYPPSRDLSGAVAQVQNYKRNLVGTPQLAAGSEFDTHFPTCVVLAGDVENQLFKDDLRKSFELYRSNLREVAIVTYDELFRRLELLTDALESKPPLGT